MTTYLIYLRDKNCDVIEVLETSRRKYIDQWMKATLSSMADGNFEGSILITTITR